jgi:plasmid replication initiation protein
MAAKITKINSRQDLTLTEKRIIFSLISLIQPEDKEPKTYTFSIKELADLIGVTEKSFYDRVEKTLDSLRSKVLVLEKKRQKR